MAFRTIRNRRNTVNWHTGWTECHPEVKIALLSTARSIRAGLIPLLDGCTAIPALGWPLHTDGPIEACVRLFCGVAGEVEDISRGADRRAARRESRKCRIAQKRIRGSPHASSDAHASYRTKHANSFHAEIRLKP